MSYIQFKNCTFIPISKNNKIEQNSDVLFDLLSEFQNEEKNQIGILFGQVQSGKTKYIEKIIRLAFNEFKYDYIFFLSGNTSILQNQSYERLRDGSEFMIYSKLNPHHANKKTIFALIKNTTNLNKIYSFISENTFSKILIIDDESDYGSINTSNIYSEPKQIHKLLKKCFDLFTHNKCSGILQVTATPYGNLINSRNLIGNVDFIYSLPINDEYTGLDYFNNIKDFYISIEEILALSCFRESIYLKKQNKEWKLIFTAILIWLLKFHQMKIDKKEFKFDLVLFNSLLNDEHDKSSDIVKYLIGSENGFINIINNDLTICEQFINLLKLDFSTNDFLNNLKNHLKEEPFIQILNSSQNENFQDVYKSNSKELNVLIGGMFLSRGNTYENLKVELISQTPDVICLDTLLQRCRWFGYRKEVAKYMAIIVSERVINALEQATYLNYHFIKNKNGEKLDIRDIIRVIREFDDNDNNVRSCDAGKRR